MMRFRLGLCVLGLLCLHTSVFGQVQPGVLIFCDDPSVEQAIHSAVTKYNERLTAGHILALFQTLSARKTENGADSLYSLHFTTRKTDCLVEDNKAWRDCEYLPHGRQEPFPCNATVHMTETKATTVQVHCDMESHITFDKAACMGCPEDIDENSEDIKVPLLVSIFKYNSISNSTHLFSMHSLGPATRQVVAGFRFQLTFDMKKTICAKADHKELHELCHHDNDTLEFAHCNSTVDVAPWRLEPPQANIECDAGPMPPSVLKRRPAGWSPMRNFENKDPSATNTPSIKEESSEETALNAKPSASPDPANNPFHCPSKPWKPFHPVTVAGPMTEATPTAGS